MSAIVLLAGVQLLTVGADPLPVVRVLTYERHLERRRRGAYPVEGVVRIVTIGVMLSVLLSKLAFR